MKYFEQRLDEENIKAKKAAWAMTGVLALVCLGLTGAIVKMLPLKMTDVKVLVVDKNTGLPSEITAVSSFETGNVKDVTANEALNKYFTQRYIIAHDSYNFYAIREAYAAVQLYSDPQVFKDYTQKFQPPVSIEKQLGRDKVLDITVLSMTPSHVPTPFKDSDSGGVTMQARVEKTIRSSDQVLSQSTGTVTMTFGYDAALAMDERARNMNPFGFTVTSYRYDPDQAQITQSSAQGDTP